MARRVGCRVGVLFGLGRVKGAGGLRAIQGVSRPSRMSGRATHELQDAPDEQDEAEFTSGSKQPPSSKQPVSRRASCLRRSETDVRLTRSLRERERASEAVWSRVRSAEREEEVGVRRECGEWCGFLPAARTTGTEQESDRGENEALNRENEAKETREERVELSLLLSLHARRTTMSSTSQRKTKLQPPPHRVEEKGTQTIRIQTYH